MSLIIAPSLLAADLLNLKDDIHKVTQAGADWLHIDVMDGHFVPNLTFGPPLVRALRRNTALPLDVHLMIEKPEQSYEQYIQAGATYLTVHAEACTHLHRTLQSIRQNQCKVGVSLNPASPINLVQHVLHMVDIVLVMSVNPGFGGQLFIPEVLRKIEALRDMIEREKLSAQISVDGGITPTTARDVVSAGATILVAGSSIFSAHNYSTAIQSLRHTS